MNEEDKKDKKGLKTTYIRYDTRCYFNVRSKADISQLNLPHTNNLHCPHTAEHNNTSKYRPGNLTHTVVKRQTFSSSIQLTYVYTISN